MGASTSRAGCSPPIRPCIVLLFFILLCACSCAIAQAQYGPLPDTAVPRKPVYGIGLDEFWIAARKASEPPSGASYASLWNFARPLGISTWEMVNVNMTLELDPLRNAASQARHERIVANMNPLNDGGRGREVEFYPFDSAVSFYWQNRFLVRSGGGQAFSQNPDPKFNGLQERVYDLTNTGANDTILKRMVYGYDPDRHTHRWDTLPRYDEFVEHTWEMAANPNGSDTFHIVVTGHLFSPQNGGGTADDNDSLLAIEIWNEVPWYTSYLDSSGVERTDMTAHRDFLYHTVYIYKRDLIPQETTPNYNAYHEVVIPVNMVRYAGGMGGPANPANSAHRMDIRVRWTGMEKVALRNIALRDNRAQLMVGSRAQDISYRAGYISAAKRIIYGPTLAPHGGAYRDSVVIRFYTGDEGNAFTDIGFNAVDSLLYNAFPWGDAATRGIRAYRAHGGVDNHAQQVRNSEDQINVENYMGDISYMSDGTLQFYYNLPYGYWQPSAIAEHNGGRWHIPELTLDSAGVGIYTTIFQRRNVGQYRPGADPVEYGRWADALGEGAWGSRRTGKRLIQWPGYGTMEIRFDSTDGPASVHREVYFTRPPEESELRMLINLGLCYGSRGIHHGWMGSQFNQYFSDRRPEYENHMDRWRFYTDFGPVGPTIADTALRYDPLILKGPTIPYDSIYHDPVLGTTDTFHLTLRYGDTLPDFFTGYPTRLREMRWLHNEWLPRIGAAMAKLQWRDGYSMHFDTLQGWMPEGLSFVPNVRQRSFPENEVIGDLTARSRTGVVDPAGETYVEVGLFEKRYESEILPDGSRIDSAQEAHYCFLLNRRTFERPSDIDPDSERGRLMDSLAETRTLRFTIRPHPDGTQLNHIRVHELEPDLTPLPLATPPRRPLDTILTGTGGTVEVTLRPGSGTLIRIAYLKPGNIAGPGDLKFNGQRKFVHDGSRYHSVYWRRGKTATDADTVFYRRSLPTSDTITDDSNYSLLWEPEYVVWPEKDMATQQKINRYPSVTVRRLGGGAVRASVVWTSSRLVDVAPQQFVMLRDFTGSESTMPQAQPVQVVDTLLGKVPEEWGTPVIARLDGGEMIAYSDSTVGIVARLRRLGGGFGRRDSISLDQTILQRAGQYPSMPPFAHIAGRDSSIAIVWEQPVYDPSAPARTDIMYARLVDSASATGDSIIVLNRATINHNDGDVHVHPSIDMTQNVWYGAEEGVTWESHEAFFNQLKQQWDLRTWVHFSSLFTETARRWNPGWVWYDEQGNRHTGGNWYPLWDSIEGMQQWTYNRLLAGSRPMTPYLNFYPSTASLNARIDTNHTTDSVLFSLALSATSAGPPSGGRAMRQMLVQWPVDFVWPTTMDYSYGGFYPSTSASLTRQSHLHAALYQGNESGSPPLYTTREFFYGKGGRPRGYLASGRQMSLRIDTSTHTGMSVRLHDIWVAGEGYTGPAPMIPRPDTAQQFNDLERVEQLFTSRAFPAHDSTVIGLELAGYFTGDGTRASGMGLRCVAELVDSSTGNVVHTLGSFIVTAEEPSYSTTIEQNLDLLSGRYFVRLRIIGDSLTVQNVTHDTRFPVEETWSYIEEDVLGKVRRLDAMAGRRGRITAHPNPATAISDIVFSIPSEEFASVTVYDMNGRELLRPVEKSMMSAGRYSVEADLSALPAGTYLLELLYGEHRVATKLVLRR